MSKHETDNAAEMDMALDEQPREQPGKKPEEEVEDTDTEQGTKKEQKQQNQKQHQTEEEDDEHHENATTTTSATKSNDQKDHDDRSNASSNKNEKFRMILAGIKIEFSEKQLPYILFLIASIINVMAACISVSEDHRYYEYTISNGSVGIGLASMGLVYTSKQRWDRSTTSKYLSTTCFLWALLGGCILTFGNGPFVETGNGYFSTWAMVVFSTQIMGVTAKYIQETNLDGCLLGLMLASIILLIGASIELSESNDDDDNDDDDEETFKVNLIYSMVLSALTIIFVERLRDIQHALKSLAMTIAAVAWIVAACLLTFDGPFTFTGNGYFAAWGGAVLCLFAANDEFLASFSHWVNRNIVKRVKHLVGADGHDNDDDDEEEEIDNDEENQRSSSKTRSPENNTAFTEDVSTFDTYQVAIDLPGVVMEDIDISLDDNYRMTVTGLRNGNDVMSTRTITQSFVVDPKTVEVDQLHAKSMKGGVLLVSAPKKTKASSVRKIKIMDNDLKEISKKHSSEDPKLAQVDSAGTME